MHFNNQELVGVKQKQKNDFHTKIFGSLQIGGGPLRLSTCAQ